MSDVSGPIILVVLLWSNLAVASNSGQWRDLLCPNEKAPKVHMMLSKVASAGREHVVVVHDRCRQVAKVKSHISWFYRHETKLVRLRRQDFNDSIDACVKGDRQLYCLFKSTSGSQIRRMTPTKSARFDQVTLAKVVSELGCATNKIIDERPSKLTIKGQVLYVQGKANRCVRQTKGKWTKTLVATVHQINLSNPKQHLVFVNKKQINPAPHALLKTLKPPSAIVIASAQAPSFDDQNMVESALPKVYVTLTKANMEVGGRAKGRPSSNKMLNHGNGFRYCVGMHSRVSRRRQKHTVTLVGHGMDGKVKSVRTTGSTLNAKTNACLARVLKRLKFPTNTFNASTMYRVVLSFDVRPTK